MSEKTWRDFDVSSVRRLLDQTVGPLSDIRFAAWMDQLAAVLDVALPCRTCGAPYPLNAPAHVCRPEDQWLWRWVRGHITDTDGTTGFRPWHTALQRRYPLKPSHTRLYRGLCFPTDAAFEAFTLNHDRYVTTALTSWTTDFDRARQFALVPVGWRDVVHRNALIEHMIADRANMAGAWGVVLSTTATPDMVLCDLAGTGFGGYRENEVIVLPGAYRVTLERFWVRQPGTTDWPTLLDGRPLDTIRLTGALVG